MRKSTDLACRALLVLHSPQNTLPYQENAKQLYKGSAWTGKVTWSKG
jgi:hypothetical protein